jgi:gluconate kinase
MRILIPIVLFLTLGSVSEAQIQPKVLIGKGIEKNLDRLVEQNATVILQAINNFNGKDFVLPQQIINGDGIQGYTELKELITNTHYKVTEEVIQTDLLMQKDGVFEIRGIEGVIDSTLNAGRKDNDREMVLLFNKNAELLSVRFALEKNRYQKMIRYSVDLEDELRRKQILSYVEQFRTAYNRKDLNYLETQFSDKALIITGVKIKKDDRDELSMKKSEVNEENFTYLKQSKKEYIERLKKLFAANSFIDVKFDGIRINQHPDYPEVYGVNLFQVWNSQNYSDEGYLFLMIDYEDENRPLIYVRAWHEKPIMVRGSGTVIDMSMFDLVK